MKITTDPRQMDMFADQVIGTLPLHPIGLQQRKTRRKRTDKPVQLEMFGDEHGEDQDRQA